MGKLVQPQNLTPETYTKLLMDVATAANEAHTIEEAVQLCLERICVHTNWCIGHAYLVENEKCDDFDRAPIWYLDAKRFEGLQQCIESRSIPLRTDLPERVIKSGKPEWLVDLSVDKEFLRAGRSPDLGLKSAFALPILVWKKVVAVLEMFSDQAVLIDDLFLEVVGSVGTQLGRVFERVRAENETRRFSANLLRAQDHERRRIARELHDSAGQYLSATNMCLREFRTLLNDLSPAAEHKLKEAADMIRQCEFEIRTVTYLLHPPMLEEMGLASAAHWYIEGFAKRSGIEIQVEIPNDLGRLDSEVELVLFRVLQECLTNIHRHSGSKAATVRIGADSQYGWLEVADRGKGIPEEILESKLMSGVGINGMRERVEDLGGVLQVNSDQNGATVEAVIPLNSGRS
jgi:signal transduction histidine kinase